MEEAEVESSARPEQYICNQSKSTATDILLAAKKSETPAQEMKCPRPPPPPQLVVAIGEPISAPTASRTQSSSAAARRQQCTKEAVAHDSSAAAPAAEPAQAIRVANDGREGPKWREVGKGQDGTALHRERPPVPTFPWGCPRELREEASAKRTREADGDGRQPQLATNAPLKKAQRSQETDTADNAGAGSAAANTTASGVQPATGHTEGACDGAVPHTLLSVKTEGGVSRNAPESASESWKEMRKVSGLVSQDSIFGGCCDLQYKAMTPAELINVIYQCNVELSCRLCPKGCVGRRALAIDGQRRRRRAMEVRRPRGQLGIKWSFSVASPQVMPSPPPLLPSSMPTPPPPPAVRLIGSPVFVPNI